MCCVSSPSVAVAADALLEVSNAEQFDSHLRRSKSAMGLLVLPLLPPAEGWCWELAAAPPPPVVSAFEDDDDGPRWVWKMKVCCRDVRVGIRDDDAAEVEVVAAADAAWISRSGSDTSSSERRCSA